MIDTDKYEGHTCKWCGYVEDAHAWHYEECPIFDDPMMKHHIAEVKRLREGIRQIIEYNEGVDADMFGSQVSDKLKEMIE